MMEDFALEQCIRCMKELADKLAAINSTISEDQIVTLPSKLPDSCLTFVVTLETCFYDLMLT